MPCVCCHEIVQDGLLANCQHLLCSACAKRITGQRQVALRVCPQCRAPVTKQTFRYVSNLEKTTASGHAIGQDDDGDSFHAEAMKVGIRGDFGTKVNALMRYLLHQSHCHREFGSGPPPKALIYSEWEIVLIELVMKAMTLNGMRFVTLATKGRGARAERDEAQLRFSEEPEVRAMLLHTAKHNDGLNLLSAQSVSKAEFADTESKPQTLKYNMCTAVERCLKRGFQTISCLISTLGEPL